MPVLDDGVTFKVGQQVFCQDLRKFYLEAAWTVRGLFDFYCLVNDVRVFCFVNSGWLIFGAGGCMKML